MGGFFGAVSHRDVAMDVFFGVDYHSHLGTRSAGMTMWDRTDGFQRQIHSISNSPFRTKFEKEIGEFHGTSGIGCISDADPQPCWCGPTWGYMPLPRWASSTTWKSSSRSTLLTKATSSWP